MVRQNEVCSHIEITPNSKPKLDTIIGPLNLNPSKKPIVDIIKQNRLKVIEIGRQTFRFFCLNNIIIMTYQVQI